MATTTLKGIVKSVNPVEFYGEGNTGRRQTVVIHVPGYTDSFGIKQGRDETWGIDIFNKKIDEFNLNSNCLQKRAECEVYLKGQEFKKKDGSGNWYAIQATLKSIKLGDAVQVVLEQEGSSDDDYIPF